MKKYHLIALFIFGIMAVSCQNGQKETGSLTANSWKLVSLRLDTISMENFENTLFVTFSDTSGAVYGSGGCNRFFGTYEAKGDTLAVQVIGSTMAYCPEMAAEDAFIRTLDQTATYTIENGTLTLKGKGKGNYASLVSYTEEK